MNTIHDRLQKAFPFLGQRAATESDLLDYCEARGVAVVFDRRIEKGIYARDPHGGDHIFLNASLHGWSLLYVLAHEIGHLVLHVPSKRRRSAVSGQRSVSVMMPFECRRNHSEAETAAALLLLPMSELERLRDAAGDRDDHLSRLVAYRLDYFARYEVHG